MKGLPRLGVVGVGLGLLVLPLVFLQMTLVEAAIAGHVVLSEIMIGKSGASTDEFIELYNPTGSEINLGGYSLKRRTEAGGSDIVIADLVGTIPAYGYYLATNEASEASGSADVTYSENVALNNRVYLYNGTDLVDMVGMGGADEYETSPTGNPPTNGSIERKASETASQLSMAFGGADELLGNGWDSNNNALDFVPRAVPGPQNTEESEAPPPTPTVEPTAEPTVTPEPTAEPEPTEEPTPTEEPEPTVTPQPTATEAPTPTEEPEPTTTPAPTAEPTPTVEPTQVPEPTPTDKPHDSWERFSFLNVTCTKYPMPFRIFGRTVYFTHVVCAPRWHGWN